MDLQLVKLRALLKRRLVVGLNFVFLFVSTMENNSANFFFWDLIMSPFCNQKVVFCLFFCFLLTFFCALLNLLSHLYGPNEGSCGSDIWLCLLFCICSSCHVVNFLFQLCGPNEGSQGLQKCLFKLFCLLMLICHVVMILTLYTHPMAPMKGLRMRIIGLNLKQFLYVHVLVISNILKMIFVPFTIVLTHLFFKPKFLILDVFS